MTRPTSTVSAAAHPILGRSDLVQAISSGQPEILAEVAEQLGLTFRPPKPDIPEPVRFQVPTDPVVQLPPKIDSTGYPKHVDNIALWILTHFATRGPLEELPDGEADHTWHIEADATKPQYQLLAPWSVIGPRIRQALADVRQGKLPDLAALVSRIARREIISEIPRQRKRRWGQAFQIVIDTSLRLTPIQHDQEAIIEHFRDMLPRDSLQIAVGSSPFSLWLRPSEGDRHESEADRRYRIPPVGSQLLVLGDLGCLSKTQDSWKAWLKWGRILKTQGCHLMALLPCGTQQIPAPLLDTFSVQSWQKSRSAPNVDPRSRAILVQRLLVLASPALRLEPGLLRDLRLLIPAASDVSLETDVWKSKMLSSNHPVAATIDRQIANQKLRPEFEQLSEDLRRKALWCIRNWRINIQQTPEIWFEELLCLPERSRRLLPDQDLIDARASVRELDRRFKSTAGNESVQAWLHRSTSRLTPAALKDEVVGRILRQMQRVLHPTVEGVAAGTDPREVPPDKLRRYGLELNDREVTILAPGPAVTDGRNKATIVASIQSTNQYFEIADDQATTEGFWANGKQPDYVTDVGTDEFGAWFEFQLPNSKNKSGHVTQRMRWIPAGTFLMGSHEDEEGRFDDEGPLHQVRLTKGFWLADTPCTQEMWAAVTGENPSNFKGEQLPIETVSWEDTQAFLEQLEQQLPGLAMSLPTEAQWEYACRAGTRTRYWSGDELDDSQANFNQNVGKTTPVKSYPANPYGLYDMHGNVLEWCQDWQRPYDSAEQVDPQGPPNGSYRVIRGGGWFRNARYARSAYRYWNAPGLRSHDLGFRCLSSVAEPSEWAEVPVAEHSETGNGMSTNVHGNTEAEITASKQAKDTAALAEWQPRYDQWKLDVAKWKRMPRTQRGEFPQPPSKPDLFFSLEGPEPTRFGGAENFIGAGPVKVSLDEVTKIPTPKAADGLAISSDLEELHFRRLTRPTWATAFGQDAYGVFADFELSAIDDPQSKVEQRLRWIPPGRFQMGSPPDEPGRRDNETLHEVRITSGFWMLETPCTQELWLAVMGGENPSRFPDPERPVERVSWDDANEFAMRISDHFEEFDFQLPTEAQWEYACRAGTNTAIYSGTLEILGDANAPDLDPIAWYAGNSGHEFDHDQPEDTSTYWLANKEKQYDFSKFGTRKVKQKRPNPWGLYDMLGNVWEWCQDWRADYDGNSSVDPVDPDEGSDRVVRGGSWIGLAQFARSAYRVWFVPGLRSDDLGFRCLSSVTQQQAERESASSSVPRDEAAEMRRTK